MAYTKPEMSTFLRSEARESGELGAAEGWEDALNNPAYIANWKVSEPAMELTTGAEVEDKTLTKSMAAASNSESVST